MCEYVNRYYLVQGDRKNLTNEKLIHRSMTQSIIFLTLILFCCAVNSTHLMNFSEPSITFFICVGLPIIYGTSKSYILKKKMAVFEFRLELNDYRE
jgi:hypothetical protein